jgi:hypothetical protein
MKQRISSQPGHAKILLCCCVFAACGGDRHTARQGNATNDGGALFGPPLMHSPPGGRSGDDAAIDAGRHADASAARGEHDAAYPLDAASQFDAGSEPDRNDVTPGAICDRLATIQCAGQAACCTDPAQDFETCLDVTSKGCREDAMLDALAAQSATGFDAERARAMLDKFEDLSSRCDVDLKAYAESFQGIRSILTGTVEPGGVCTPSNALDNTMVGAALGSCAQADAYACLPAVIGAWTCKPHAAAGGACFTDANCMADLWCDNDSLALSGGSCRPRKPVGASCVHSHECESLAREGSVCVAASAQTVYCL